MSRLLNTMRMLVLAACLAPLLALAASGSSYRVTLADARNADPAAAAKQIAAQYHGHLESAVDEHGAFLMTLSTATADLLRRDPRVSRVERPEVTATAAVAPDAADTWTLGDGNYQYDGSGNIKAIGSQVFVYDVENRLVSEKSAATTPAVAKQTYTYDGFGNILTYKDDDGITYTVGASAATNRASVTSSAAFHMSGTYDPSGNMIARSDDTFRYDALNVMTKSFVDGQWRAYVYNVSDERVGTILMTAETAGAETSSEWTIRDPGGQVLRRFAKQGGQYVWQQDYIYRDGKMLASEVTGQIGTLHYHLDHLGSPRLITGNGGVQVSRHTYYPFGKEVVTGQPVREDKKFTGHERDPIGLDYMHARFYDYRMGRFLSVDPGRDWDRKQPQSWNLYSYVRNNPVNATDPDGRQAVIEFVAPYAPQVIASFATVYFLSRYSLHARANMRSRPGPVLVPPAVLSQRPHIVTPSGTILPGGTDVNLVPTATGTGWLQIHDAHPHDGAQPHTHRPETHVEPNGEIDVKRTDKPTTAEDIDEADRRVKDGELRPRTDRKDKGDRRPKPEPKKDEEPKEQQ